MQREFEGVTNTSMFMPGDVVVLRYRRHEPADVVMPVRIVKDTARLIALYICPGTALHG